MVAELPILLSSPSPETTIRGVLGDRFHFFAGLSGRRYPFSLIGRDELVDFRSAVVVIARRERQGLRALAVAEIDDAGVLDLAHEPHPDCVVLVHLLAENPEERRVVVADLACRGESRRLEPPSLRRRDSGRLREAARVRVSHPNALRRSA